MRYIFLVVLGFAFGSRTYAQIQINGSYLNLTRPTGGPVVSGDILEIRAVIGVPSGTTVTNLQYQFTLPTGTTYVAGSMKAETNEGQVVSGLTETGTYTDASDTDPAYFDGTNIWMNLGAGATSSAGGTLVGGSTPPLFYNVASILMAAFQVKVTGNNGANITTTLNNFTYNLNGASTTTSIPTMLIKISPAYSCGVTGTNSLPFETNGTFGSGSTLDRSTASPSVTGYTFTTLTTGAPNDGQYSIVTNTSGTGYTGTSPASSDKVFGDWDVIGDHTGSTTGTGNPAAASGTTAGYMLAVNATYAPAVVFTANITGLLPNTTYSMSFWLYNICPVCGVNQVTGNANGTPGVKPNLAINVNGINYYSTGDLPYTGQWVQSSFTFFNGSASTALFEIKNNAPGGGGNDWALDDIALSQCLTLLPIGLQSFTGHAIANGSLLNWQFAPSPSLDHFVVERSTNGSTFTSTGEVAASTDVSNYSFTDDQLPAASKFFYRLQLVTVDGEITYSPVLEINANSNTTPFSVNLWPNPAHASTNLSIWADQGGPATIALIDAAGKPVFSRMAQLAAGSNAITLVLPDRLARGIYIVRTTSGSNSFQNRLIVD